MRKSILLYFAALAAMFSTSVNAQNAWGLAGSGTESDPYQVKTAADFAAIANNLSADNKGTGEYFKMMNDVDFGGSESNLVAFPNIGKSGVVSLVQINYGFDGTFDGDGKTVNGIYASSPVNGTDGRWNAIFCALDENAVVKNLIVGADNRMEGYTYTAAVACISKGVIENCTNYATVKSVNSYAAGILGFSCGGMAKVKDCVNNGPITAKSYACGIVGGVENLMEGEYTGEISGCVNNASIATEGAGASGIVGSFTGGALFNNTNNGKVEDTTGKGQYTAGIVASFYNALPGQFYGNENNGEVIGNKYVGGIVGYVMRTQNTTSIVVTGHKNTGKVSGNLNTAGIVGSTIMAQDIVTISGCTNTGVVTCVDEATGGNLRGNALIALGDGNVIAKGLKHYALDPVFTAINDINVENVAKAHKYIDNGQLIIEMEGIKYNAAGQIVK
ncbi:MAG: hypothetical protein MJZ74_10135 [Muribaculaceae bacterium]|nr:hypothetical protein [Muribaculaceae bacterium]